MNSRTTYALLDALLAMIVQVLCMVGLIVTDIPWLCVAFAIGWIVASIIFWINYSRMLERGL